MNTNNQVDLGKVHDDVELAKITKNIDQEEIAKVVESAKVSSEIDEHNKNSTQHRFPPELVKIFKTLGMHAPTGIRPPGSAVYRAKMNRKRKAARGR